MYALQGMTSLGTVRSEDVTKDAQLFQMPMPASDSSQLIALDLFGAAKTIDIKGIFNGTLPEINTFIGQLQNLVNGSQLVRRYTSEALGGNVYVLVQNIKWTYEEGVPNKINWDISMLEASSSTGTLP